MDEEERFVTTSDNPFDYFSQFEQWYAFDTQHGYNTCAYLARLARTSPELSDNDNRDMINRAVDEVLRLNLTGNYILAVPKDT